MTEWILEKHFYEKIRKHMPTVCVDLLVTNDQGQYLVALRKEAPAQGFWWFPGGRIYKDETIEHTALRKGKEELGESVDFEVGKFVSVEETIFEKEEYHTVNIVYNMKYKGGDIKIDTFHDEYKWLDVIDESLHPAVKNPLKVFGFE